MSCDCFLIRYLDERFAKIDASQARIEAKLDDALDGRYTPKQYAELAKLRDKLGANDEAVNEALEGSRPDHPPPLDFSKVNRRSAPERRNDMADTTIEELVAAVEKETTDTGSLLVLQAKTKALYEEALNKVHPLTPEQQQAMNAVHAKLIANDQPVADALAANVPDDQP